MNARRLALFFVAFAACAHAEAPPPAQPAAAQPATAQAAAPEAAKVLETKPQVGALRPFAAPIPIETRLANGLTLIVVERPSAPLETVVFATRHGATNDGKLSGLASLAGELLQAGSAGRSAAQIAAEANALGTELHVGASREDLTAAMTVLPDKLPQAVSLIGDVVLRPNLEAKEFDRVKHDRKAKLVALLDDPRALASNAFNATLFGDSAYGRPLLGTQSTIAKITLADVKGYLSGIGGANSALVFAGPATREQVRALVEKSFASQPAGKPEPKVQAEGDARRPPIVLVDKPGAPQSVLRLGQPSVDALHPDRYALELANLVFGGSFTSRINQNLRERHGYTYGAHSDFEMLRGGGYFLAATDVKTAVTAASIHELEAELAAMASPGLTEADVDKARALFTMDLVDDLQTTPGTARAVAELWTDGRPLDELSKTLPAIAHLTAKDVNAAWGRAVDQGKLTLVIVGDAKDVEQQLASQKLPKPVRVAPPK